ncbi:MAG: hypothetical protein DWQ05_18190 [Calditrichaeota bacterium]|nr:MAG: hypothetical protein DWQ05_18190 [Calditrichota bacterium]
MYFKGSLAIDPAQLTNIEFKKPENSFASLVHVLTGGLASKKEEYETFTAVSILQQINLACQNLGINNMVRLAKDDIDFYLDVEGKQDDLDVVLEKFRLETDRYESELFDKIFIVLEHEEDLIKYLFEIDINRKHSVGAYPIEIKINGVLSEFKSSGASSAETKAKMKSVFSSQEKYDTFLSEKQAVFNQFVSRFEQSVRRSIRVDEIKTKTSLKMVRPKKPVNTTSEIPVNRNADPVYYGYHGFGDFFLYAWLWSSFAHTSHIHCHNFDLVDEQGQTMMEVGENGFDAGATDTLNPEADFEAPEGGDVEFLSGHDYDADFAQADLDLGGEMPDVSDMSIGEDSGSWFDSIGDSVDFGDIDF